ncbi:DNA gyrase subunit A [Paeniglutamicibacter sp. Y32M11]|uniref:DNA gyrase subunit A n=1 Tax=Paeniglutamicibacter sp. Y32M11 TaxID=2853258 RepID=UPI001C528B84|nr:DNA gyrase subunit A [Paeniglutamicibacter sp. Y32M11]QXQ10355.1 DNA gyrase subunit A [Paeniglutamicibacter sp. Y32M11]
MEPESRKQKQMSLQMLEVMLQAINRREEVFRAIESSRTDDEARKAVAELLRVGDIRARLVLDMQARRWTLENRNILSGQIQQLQAELDSL